MSASKVEFLRGSDDGQNYFSIQFRRGRFYIVTKVSFVLIDTGLM